MMRRAFEEDLQLLYSALQVEAFRFILVSHNHPSVYKDIWQALIERFGRHKKIHEFSFQGKSPAEIRDAVLRLDKGVMLLRDVELLFRDENAALCTYFNQRRDFFAKHDIAFVFFIAPDSFRQVVKKLPDWWSLRSLELEFVVPLDAAQGAQGIWNAGEHSPYANWTQEDRDAETARLQRLIADTDTGNLNLLGRLYADLGDVLYASSKYEAALARYQESLPFLVETGNRNDEGIVLNNIGMVYRSKGDYDAALHYLEQSLALKQQIGDLQGEEAAMSNLSQIYQDKGDYGAALRYLEQALSIVQQLGDRKAEGVALNNLSQVYLAQGDQGAALRYLEQSLALRQQIGDRQGEGASLNNLGIMAQLRGDFDASMRYLEQALAIQRQIGDRQSEGATLKSISHIYQAKGDYGNALRCLEQALIVQQQIGYTAGIASTLLNIGAIHAKQADYQGAISMLLKAHQLYERIGSPNSQLPAEHLQAILERIGEMQYGALVSKAKEM